MDKDKSILDTITDTVKDIATLATDAASHALQSESPPLRADGHPLAYMPMAGDAMVADPMLPPIAMAPARKKRKVAKKAAAKPAKKAAAKKDETKAAKEAAFYLGGKAGTKQLNSSSWFCLREILTKRSSEPHRSIDACLLVSIGCSLLRTTCA